MTATVRPETTHVAAGDAQEECGHDSHQAVYLHLDSPFTARPVRRLIACNAFADFARRQELGQLRSSSPTHTELRNLAESLPSLTSAKRF